MSTTINFIKNRFFMKFIVVLKSATFVLKESADPLSSATATATGPKEKRLDQFVDS